MFARFKDMLVVTRVQVQGWPHNVALLNDARVRCLVLLRDPMDVAVSEVCFVRRLRWLAGYRYFAGWAVDEGPKVFAERTSPAHLQWFRSWHGNWDPVMSLTLRYEDLLSDPVKAMTEVAKLFALDQSLQRIGEIVEAHSFQRLSKGRSQGQEDRSNHSFKRVAGDRKNYFAPEIKETHRELIGDLLIELGCKQDDSWQPPSGVARSCGRCRLEKMIVERVPQQPVGRTSRCSGQGCSRLPGHCRIPAGARRDVTVYARKRITPAVTPSG